MSESSSFPGRGSGRQPRSDLERGRVSPGDTRSRSPSWERKRREPPRTAMTDTWPDRDDRDQDSRRSPSPRRQGSRLPFRPRSPTYGERQVKRPRLNSLVRAQSSRESSVEPGQYPPRSTAHRRRSPSYTTPELSRRPSSSSSYTLSPVKGQRNLPVLGSRASEPSGRVDSTTLAFSRAMHNAMLSTSTHALASESFSRLNSFPAGKNNEAAQGMIREAQSRVQDAEAALKRRMWELQQAFDAVLKTRTKASPWSGLGKAKNSAPPAVEVKDVVNGSVKADHESRQSATTAPYTDAGVSKGAESPSADRAETNGADVDMLLADAPPASDRPGVSDAVALGREGAKIKLRTLIGNLENRVQEVENMKTSLEERYFDLENEFYVLHGDFVQKHRSRARPETWEAFERERYQPISQREQVNLTAKGGIQVSSPGEGGGQTSRGFGSAAQTDLAIVASPGSAQPPAGAEQTLAGEAPTARPKDYEPRVQDPPLSERTLDAIKTASAETLSGHELFLGALKTIADLRAEVETLKSTIQRLEDGQIQRERRVTDDALKRAREDYTSIVGAELDKALGNVDAARTANTSASQPRQPPQPSQSPAPAPPVKPAVAPSLPVGRAPSASATIVQQPSLPYPSPVMQPTGPGGPRAQSAGASSSSTPIGVGASASLPPRPAYALPIASRAMQLASAPPAPQRSGAALASNVRPLTAAPTTATRALGSLAHASSAPASTIPAQLQSHSMAASGLKERLAVPPPALSGPSGSTSPTPIPAVPRTSASTQQASYAPLAQRLNNASPQPLSGSSFQTRIASGGRSADNMPAIGTDSVSYTHSPSLRSRIELPTKPVVSTDSAANSSIGSINQALSSRLAHPASVKAPQPDEQLNGQVTSGLASRITSAQAPPQLQQHQMNPQQLAWLHANGQPGGATPQVFQPQNQSWQQPPR